jgi:hypothetical protein
VKGTKNIISHFIMSGVTGSVKVSLLAVFLFCASWNYSQTVMVAGDIAITGFNFDNSPDQFSFVLLTDITTTTSINFTDNGWLSSGSFRGGEGTCVWAATSAMTCGTEVTITGTGASAGSVSSNTMALSGSGDQILAYQGAAGSPTHIFAINSEGAAIWQANATSSNTSAIPTGLTNGTNAIALTEVDNAIYNCSVLSDETALLAAICVNANWSGSNTVLQTVGTGCAFACVACVAAAEPTTEASASSFPTIACNAMDISWTNGDGANRIVVMSLAAVVGTPTDLTSYTANTVFGSGAPIAANEYVVFNGAGTAVSVTGLVASTTYHIAIYEYNGVGTNCDENYLITTPHANSDVTIVCPVPTLPSSQGLLINEFSNGPSGSKEYYEFVVAGQCGDVVDVSGYILDDNNGTFSTVFPSTSGVAAGHLRLTNHAQWTAIPVGSLIVIYNSGDVNASLPADDVNDANGDSLYVIPDNNTTYFELTTDLPDNAASDSTYTPSVYGTGGWATLGLRNGGDAVQVRDPSGAYWHGVSYGGAEMTGGPNNMKVAATSLTNSCAWFSDGDFLDVSNWTTGALSNETPGAANDAANLIWIKSMRDAAAPSCPVELPVDLLFFRANRVTDNHNNIHWRTASEKNNVGFELLRSSNGIDYEVITFVPGSGTTSSAQHYEFDDYNPTTGLNYYKLRQIDYDGVVRNYSAVVVNNESNDLAIDYWNVDYESINISLEGYSNFKPIKVEFLDILGKVISIQEMRPSKSISLNRQKLSDGVYLVRITQGNTTVFEKIKL